MPVDPAVRSVPVVPGYVLEELLGRGGSGEVWRGRPRVGGESIAVKVLVRGDPERQVREAAMLAELDHPHLVRLHRVVRRDVRGEPAEVALVLDLLAGGSLAALLARRGRLRPGEVVTTVAPVAAALAQAHDRGVVHGDLSPGNIVFTAEGRPVLTDLGTARLVGEAGRAEVTPAYVDPVVARGGAPGPASDVFGVAAAAFHALTGIAPWNAADPAGTLTVAARGEVPDLAVLAPDAPAELVRVVRRGLSLEPHLRGSAAAFALDLRHACRPEPVRLPTPGTPDEVLGETGNGPRTELTHQVADRRPRAAHTAHVDTGRLVRLWAALRRGREADAGDGSAGVRDRLGLLIRRCAGSLAALVVIGTALAGAVWVGANWGSRPAPVLSADTAGVDAPTPEEIGSAGGGAAPSGSDSPAPRPDSPGLSSSVGRTTAPPPGPTVPAPLPSATTALPPVPPLTSTAVGSPTGPTTPRGSGGAADATGSPATGDLATGDRAGWATLVGQLYTRRAGAYATADPAWLADVYVPDSDLFRRDRDQVQALAAARQTVSGYAPVVRQVTAVEGDGRSVLIDLVDEVPGYRIVPVDDEQRPTHMVSGRGPAEVSMRLQRTPVGWRIVTATRQD